MSAKPILVLFVSAALALAVAIGSFESSSPSYEQHERFATLLAERRGMDQDIVLHALEARFDYSANYDQLAKDDHEERRLATELAQQVPSFLRPDERQQVERALGKYSQLAAERQSSLEHFKSVNALLKNSLHYFPSAAAAVLRQTRDEQLAYEINELRAITIAIAAANDASLVDVQQATLQRVRELGRSKLAGSEQRALELMLMHARAIATHKKQTDRLLTRIVDIPVAPVRHELASSYQRAHARATRQAHDFVHYMSGLALVLLGSVGYAGVRLRRAAVGLSRANERLEVAVEQRTTELKAEMAHNARMEIELRQAQKLEAVGQLASGVAHEINTPIQYVGDSVYFLREAFGDVLRLLDAHREALAGMAGRALDPARLAELQQATRDADLDMLIAEIHEAFERTAEGTKQVASIVRAMKTFAHTSVEKAPLDLNAAIQNTLTVSRNEYKYVADVETRLGTIPEVTCNAGGVRQVFVNLIVNAAHAIADVVQGSEQRGKIVITTALRGDSVEISVSDTGGGIPEAIRERIFDPFFTTKEPGRGSGQGLSISQSIVKQHGGTLRFETELGRGSTFFVVLPIAEAERKAGLAPQYAA